MATDKVTIDAIDNALRTLGSNGKECGDCDCQADGLARQLIPLVDKLDERRKLVVVQRYGLQGEEPKTLQAIGDQLNRTRERIRQIQNMGLTKLQEMLQNG